MTLFDVTGRVSKFRHLHGTVMPRNTHLENFRGLDNALPTECNGFHGNSSAVFVSLSFVACCVFTGMKTEVVNRIGIEIK